MDVVVLTQGVARSVLAQIWALYSKWISAFILSTLEGLVGFVYIDAVTGFFTLDRRSYVVVSFRWTL